MSTSPSKNALAVEATASSLPDPGTARRHRRPQALRLGLGPARIPASVSSCAFCSRGGWSFRQRPTVPRIDLRRNGIGDGGYAFEVELPEALAGVTASLTVVAVSATHRRGNRPALPSQDERAAEAAVNGPLSRVLDQLEILIEAQRRSQIMQRETVEAHTHDVQAGRRDRQPGGRHGCGPGSCPHQPRRSRARRSRGIEVFHLRFDKVLADFDKRIEELTKAADRPMRRAVALLIAFGGLSAVSAIITLVVVLRHGLR